MALIPTLLTPKFSLGRAIPQRDMPTSAAFLTGVADLIIRYAVLLNSEAVISKKSSAKPLLVDEVPIELRGYLAFDNQYSERWGTRGSSLTIDRTCRQCQKTERVRVMNIRQSLKNKKFTALCASCTSKINSSAQPKGHKSHKWKGGKFITSKGYVMARAPEHPNACNRYVFEHRLVMEKSLGRYLLRHETVHHKNGVGNCNLIPAHIYPLLLLNGRVFRNQLVNKFS